MEMQQAATTPLSAMDPATMRAVYNYLAEERGQPLAPKRADRFELGKGIALLRATPKPSSKPLAPARRRRDPVVTVARAVADRPSIIRDCALTELARVVAYQNVLTGKVVSADCFEEGNDDGDQWITVGATYAEVAAVVRKQIPKSRISPNVLRRFVHHVKKVATMDEAKQPVPPLLEAYRNVVLPERRPKPRTIGATNHGRPDKDSRPTRAAAAAARAVRRNRRAKLGAKRGASGRGRKRS